MGYMDVQTDGQPLNIMLSTLWCKRHKIKNIWTCYQLCSLENKQRNHQYSPKTLETKPKGNWEAKKVRNQGAAYRDGATSLSSRWPWRRKWKSCRRRDSWYIWICNRAWKEIRVFVCITAKEMRDSLKFYNIHTGFRVLLPVRIKKWAWKSSTIEEFSSKIKQIHFWYFWENRFLWRNLYTCLRENKI